MHSEKQQLIYGRHPVIDAIKAGKAMDKVVLQQGVRGDFEKELRFLGKTLQIPIQVVPKERLNKWVKGNHQGVIAFLSLIPYYRLEDLIPMIFERSETPLLVLLDRVTDVRNFGAIARSAECFGAHGLIISKKGNASINPEAMKTSAGALTKIPVCREGSLIKAIEVLQSSGIQVFASDLKAEKKIFNLDLKIPIALIIGSEGEGISTAISEAADASFFIPQLGTTDSLNASVATGIILYEAIRQRLGE